MRLLQQILGVVLLLTGALTPVVAQQPLLKLLVLGDSLSAGYNLPAEDAYPAQLGRLLKSQGLNVAVTNAGVSGDTATGGLARLEWSLGDGFDAVIVELGANDMLRGIDPAETEAALDAILSTLKSRNLPVLLAGMIAAPGMGQTYEARFNAIYPRLAEKHSVSLYPFFLEGVASQRELLLPDGMHPNKHGVAIMAQKSLPKVLELLRANVPK